VRGTPTSHIALCSRFSVGVFGFKNRNGFRPSHAYVPTPLAWTGFGPPAAQCEADPNLGIYYLVRIWTAPVSRSRIRVFERRLISAGFRLQAGGRGTTRSYRAPPGVPDVVDDRPTQMQSVYISPATKRTPMTALMWI
jgi:hypothetical protein